MADIKQLMLEQPDKITELLDNFGFCNIRLRGDEIRCAREHGAGINNISVRLVEHLPARDWVRGIQSDIIGLIIQDKNVSFREVLQCMKQLLGLQDDWRPAARKELFGGLYARLNKKGDIQLKTYDEEKLLLYDMCPNQRWLREGISLEAQKFYQIGYDTASDRIIFPWRSPQGELIAIKGRINIDDIPEDIPKYLYLLRNNVSQSLFNYSECYEHLYNADKIYVFESEKSCMKAWGWGIKNTVAIGSHTLSDAQVKLLLQLNPKEIVLCLDNNLDLHETIKDAKLIQKKSSMFDVSISYWDWRQNITLPEKAAPVDDDLDTFQSIIDDEVYPIDVLERTINENI